MKNLNKFFLLVLIGLSINFTTEAQTTYWTNAGNYDTSWYDVSQTTFNLGTAAQLAGLAYLVNGGNEMSGKTFNLTSDINLSAHEWVPIGKTTTPGFLGNFDGGNHTIQNMIIHYQDSTEAYGLFGNIGYDTIRNTIAGAGCVINIEEGSYQHTGMIVGCTHGNCRIENCHNHGNVTGTGNTGGICGVNNSEGNIISQCSNSGNIKSTGNSTGGIGGGLGTYYNCYNTGDVTTMSANQGCGGIVGYTYFVGDKIVNCYNVGDVEDPSYAGGIVGFCSVQGGDIMEIINCYNAGQISGTSNKGGLVGSHNATPEMFTATSYYIPFSGSANSIGTEKTESEMKSTTFVQQLNDSVNQSHSLEPLNLWQINASVNNGFPTHSNQVYVFNNWTDEGNYDTSWYDGLQTTFNISTAAQFAGLAYLVNNGNNMSGKTINLTANVDLEEHLWVPIGCNEDTKRFYGHFNGNGHSVSNMMIIQRDFIVNAYGLFGAIENATVENITTDATCLVDRTGCEIPNVYNTGGIVGVSFGESVISNCHNAGTIIGKNDVGGIVGAGGENNTTTINACSNSGTVSGDDSVGGICGMACSVINCYNTGTIENTWASTGGIIGAISRPSHVVLNCYNTGSVTDAGGFTGGIVGYAYYQEEELYQVRNCYNAGVVSSSNTTYMGGVVGRFTANSVLLLCPSYRLPLENGNSYGIEKTEAEMTAAAFTQLLNDSVTAYNTAHPAEIQWETWLRGADNYPCFGYSSSVEENNMSVISVYPNPAKDMLTIEAVGMRRISIVSVLGQVIYDAEENSDVVSLNMGQYKSGIYVVRVFTENGVGAKRVLIVH